MPLTVPHSRMPASRLLHWLPIRRIPTRISSKMQLLSSAGVPWFSTIQEIVAPGTVDGGDVCDAGERLYIGVSHRTNHHGAKQLAHIAKREGKDPVIVDVRRLTGILHLKSAMAYLDNDLVATVELQPLLSMSSDRNLTVTPEEMYAANCVLVNDVVFVASGYPRIRSDLERAGYATVMLDVSEFRKMDGGLSCLSIRF